jgi:hypothetical protein
MTALVAGNSQAGALRLAIKEGLLDGEDVIRPHFYVIPGGTGPTFAVVDGKLCVTAFNGKFPPYAAPPEVTNRPLDEYQVVFVSALGFVDGGFLYQNPIIRQGYVAEFCPRAERPDRPLLSRACFGDIVRSALLSQPGFVFLRQLRAAYKGKIVVQPFPYSSSYLAEREDWELRTQYEDFLGFNRFLFSLRDAALRDICSGLGVDLLPLPDEEWAKDAFTPRELMRDSDGLHPLPAYGAMVLRQFTSHLTKAPCETKKIAVQL